MKCYQIALNAKVIIQEETLASTITIPWTTDQPLWFDKSELIEATEDEYHFKYHMRHYFVNKNDVTVFNTP
jgi:hypothetical protein